MTVSQMESHLRAHNGTLRNALLAGAYDPQPVRKLEIPKPAGGTRTLGIPTVLDRLVQQALLQVLQPLLDPGFSRYSFAYRPGRSAHGAVRQAQKFVVAGLVWTVRLDLEKFFDRVDHTLLLERLARFVTDGRVIELIRRFLTASFVQGWRLERRTTGTPQGGPLSPLLANLMLDDFDKLIEARGLSFCRFADDVCVHVATRQEGDVLMEELAVWLERELRLKVNRTKSRVALAWEEKFLGYRITADRARLQPAPEAWTRLRSAVGEILERGHDRNLAELIDAEINPLLRGWREYFRLANGGSFWRWAETTLCDQLRRWEWQRWGTSRRCERKLRRRGVSPAEGHLLAHQPKHPGLEECLRSVLPNEFFARRGLLNVAGPN
jgi:RNA-directed DNA polymerase